ELKMDLKGRILVYSISGCPHCKAAKEKLDSLNLPYNDVNLDNHPEQRDIMMKLTDQRSVPQIFFNEHHIGGNDKFQELSKDRLNELIELVKHNEPPPDSPQPVMESNTHDVPASELSLLIRKTILHLYGDFLSKDGKHVDYTGISESVKFKDYVEQVAQLQRAQIDDMPRQESLAFFINIYNALVIHANIKLGFPETTWQRYKFFNDASYIIGGHKFNLQEIENGVLRANRKGVGMMVKPFSKSDPRLQYILQPNEPLIHFALVCGAKSCPPIKTYSPDNIENQLKLAAASFLEGEDGCRVDKKQGLIGLSLIFKWYKEDFGNTPHEVLLWVKEHMPNGLKKQDLALLLDKNAYKLVYLHYDWGSNKK
uniref:Uncharacterized protein n=1 Tax=Ciona intestinalis TaxID=7719 RepID=H2XX86_CIOIN